MRRITTLAAALLAVATALVLAYYCGLGFKALLIPRGHRHDLHWFLIVAAAPALLLLAALLLSAWRAIRWVAAPRTSSAGSTNEAPRLRRIVMLLVAAPAAGVLLAAVLEAIGVWHDSSIGVWQLLIYPCLIIAPVLTMLGFPRPRAARGSPPGPA
jgi:hypothetical protein